MLTGKKRVPADLASSVPSVGALRFLMTVAISSTLVWGIWSGDLADYFKPIESLQTAALRLGW
jgi:hypothetical protein